MALFKRKKPKKTDPVPFELHNDAPGENTVNQDIRELGELRAPHNPHQQLITAAQAGERTATELVAEARAGGVPALAQAVGTIAQRFEGFVQNIHALNVALADFKRDVMVPFHEELKYLRYTTGDRLNHASSDLEKYVAKLDQVMWAALRAQGMTDEQIRKYREENGMQPEAPRGYEIERHIAEVQAMKDTIATLTKQNQRLLARQAAHVFANSEDYEYNVKCGCVMCAEERKRMRAASEETQR